jgi:putative peptidoglycan lipid II flippase
MRAVSFGSTTGDGPGLLAAALAAMAIGLFPYGAFLLLARSYYALGDSRSPGLVALASAAAGLAVMAVGAVSADGWARIATLGFGHSAAYLVGSAVLLTGLTRRTGGALWPQGLARMAAVSAAAGAAMWSLARQLDGGGGRRDDVIAVVVPVLLGAGIAAGGFWLLGLTGSLTRRVGGTEPNQPTTVLT